MSTETAQAQTLVDTAAVAASRPRLVSGDNQGAAPHVQFMSVPQVAEYLNTSERFVRRLVEERRVVFHKFGTHVRFDRRDIDAFVAAARVEIPIARRRAS